MTPPAAAPSFLRYKVELFHRTSRGVRVTETGAHLLAIVRRMFGSYDEAVAFLDEVHGMRQGQAGSGKGANEAANGEKK